MKEKQTVTLNLAIEVDLSQLATFLATHMPRPTNVLPLPEEPALTLQEAAKILNCSDQKVRDLVNQRIIPPNCAFRVGSLYRFHRRELMGWVRGDGEARTA